MKIAALDLGDKWTGIALSDPSMFFAYPYKTIETKDIIKTIQQIIDHEELTEIVVGYAQTMKGTHSAQTETIIKQKELLEKQFPQLLWHLWDERMTSQQAAKLKKTKTKEQKLQLHSIAAAIILQMFLDFRAMQKNNV
jgi:putative Holliday junction resolvase